ncbi:hypothetical protein D9M68_993900 [compost metagenome]
MYGTTISHFCSSLERPKILPSTLAWAGVAVIWPRHRAVVHSLDWPTFLATSAQLRPLLTLVEMIFSVTSSRLMCYLLMVEK